MTKTATTAGEAEPTKGERGSSGFPFYTEVVDGELKTLVLFIPSTKKFYEMLPEGHEDIDPDASRTLKDPRSGDIFTYSTSFVERQMQKVHGNHCVGTVDAERWADFREDYLEADETDIDEANEFLDKHVFGYEEGEEPGGRA
ncbi:hypothetical protein [Halorhabdus rudnickae]|uniref:hypothetical protein n=1 Tax=Halorhabdus rudnickae TaxID=1775544 RepID=UPI001083D4AB|nr:hypothetical protein [Halorhabdus rudnickae]